MSDANCAGPTPKIPVSWGELIDKISILEIKRRRLTSPAALANVSKELTFLQEAADAAPRFLDSIVDARRDLRRVNEDLWNIEVELRQKESLGQFDSAFIELARSVYRLNDRRAALKRAINMRAKSEIIEEKSYARA